MTGLFLGAGASFEAGLPLVWDLTAEIRTHLSESKVRSFNADWKVHGGGYPDAVIDDFILALRDPRMHYESVLGYLETQYRRYGPYQPQYHGLYSWLVDLVWYLLYLRHANNHLHIVAGLRYIDGIVGLAEVNRPLWIFSLNHDLIVECLAAEYNISLSCGFTGSTKLPLRDASGKVVGDLPAETVPEADLDASRLKFFPPGAKGINLLKIHGALDVFTYNEGKDVLRIGSDPSGAADVLTALIRAHEGLKCLDPNSGVPTRLKVVNEIIYTDSNNDMQLLRRSLLAGAFKFDPRRDQTLPKIYIQLFSSYIAHVAELICIGYSFGDDHINIIIRQWLELSGDRRLVIVSPNASSVPSPLLHLASQVTIVPASATAYLEQFSPQALSPVEVTLRDLRATHRAEQRAMDGFA